MKRKTLLLVAVLIFIGAFLNAKIRYIQKNTSTSQVSDKIVPKAVKEGSENWKFYKGTSFKSETVPAVNISFKYPPDWTYKEEYAHATSDLGVFFTDQQGSRTISFIYSELPFKEGFYNSQKEYLGQLSPFTLKGKKGYMFKEKYGYKEGYYFPLKKGYFSLQLYDMIYRDTLEHLILTVNIDNKGI